MKRIFIFSVLMIAFVTNAVAQDKTTMVETHDFTGFNNGASISWGEQTGDDLNSSWDRVTLLSITGNVNGVSTTRNYYSWIDGKPRFSVGRASDWQYWDNGWQMTQENAKTFYINRLDAGDKVSIEYRTDQTLHMKSGNTSLEQDAQIISGQEFTVNSAGGVEIECSNRWAVIYKVTIATKHLATYVIDHQTYTFTSGGVLPDKRKAVPYITMTFGNENMDYAYVRYYGEENGVKQFGSFMLTETMDDTYFKDYINHQDYYQNEQNWNNANGPYVLHEPVVFKGGNFAEYVPWHGTYYYFYPETNGKLYIHMHSDPVTSHNNWGNDPMFLWDKSINEGASSFNYNTEGFYKFGSNPQNGVRVKKDHVYFMCTTPNDPRRRNVAHLTDYTFVPDFTMTPLYKVIEHGYEPQTSGEIAVSNLMYTDNNPNLHYRVKKCLGNIESAEVEIKNNKLYFTKITYKSGDKVNKGGSVIVDVDCTDGQADFVLTVPYSAEPSDNSGKQVQTWDFYNNILDDETVGYNYDENYEPFKQEKEPLHGKQHLGQYSNTGSGLYYETHEKVPGEWLNTYIDLENSKEPIFKNVYDMEGDNADMIWDTNGLIIHAHSGTTGFYNENGLPTSGFSDRFLGFMPGSKLVIPRLKANDRVVIKMGSFGNADKTLEHQNAILKLNNAKDAVGTTISGDYIIGGSMPYPDETGDAKTQPHGEYHFIVANNSTSEENDFAIEVAEGTDLLKIYSITIYTNDDIVTENSITTADGPEMLFTDEDAAGTTKDMEFYLRYRGFEEPSQFGEFNNNFTRGNLNMSSSSFRAGTKENSLQTTFTKGDFGSFRADAEVYTKDDNNTYVTDYTPGSLAVDYLNKVEDGYPYTWDFTDLLSIVNLPTNQQQYIHDAINMEIETPNRPDDYDGWKLVAGNYSMRNAPEQEPGILFANGGQIYGATKMFAEMAGIGFKRSTDTPEDAKLLNESLAIRSGALELNSDKDDVFYKLVVPKVDAGAAIYVRATPLKNAKMVEKFSTDGETGNPFSVDDAKILTTADGDKIYVVRTTAEQNVELWLNGMAIKKIAVATDLKTVNDLGWNTESRGYTTDPSLLSYMTGKDFRTYVVLKPNEDEGEEPISVDKPVTLTRIDGGSKDGDATGIGMSMIIGAAEENGSPNACIVRYVGTKGGEDIFDEGEGFHIFVPDMHDGPSVLSDNLLKAQVKSGTVLRNETIEGTTYNNYAFTNKWKYVDSEGNELTGRGGQKVGDQAFYRIMKDGATSANGNQAYLSIEGTDAARLAIFIEDEEYDGEATGIATVESTVGGVENARYYNLNGQQLSGKPNRSGLYIVNGKKVSIKNK